MNQTNDTEYDYHVPVLLNEVMELLSINPSGTYVDCTFGGGGHSKIILTKLNAKGRLIAFDQDADAKANVPDDPRVLFIPQNFRHLQRFLKLNGITEIDGLLADLGVSSHQFDEGSRGFSIRFDGPLDMRMDARGEKTAADIVNTYTEAGLHKLFEQYGEVTNSKTLAAAIVQKRQAAPFQTTEAFRDALFEVVRGNPNKYFAQVFQALRIEVNEETEALKELLEGLPTVLKKGGRAAIITFHSIEDRLVKLFFKHGAFVTENENPFVTIEFERHLKPVNKKPIVASSSETKLNSRSRSAKLRVAERK